MGREGTRKEDSLNFTYSKEAVKHISTFDRPTKQRIKEAIEKLPAGDVKKLKGYQYDYRLRVGNYRVLFQSKSGEIIIKDVLPRGQAYKNF